MNQQVFYYSTSTTCSHNVRVELLSHGRFGVSTSVCHIQHRMLIVSSNPPINMTKLKQYLAKAGLNTTTRSIFNMAGQLEATFFPFSGPCENHHRIMCKIYIMSKHISSLCKGKYTSSKVQC